ncbi:MAG: hypothetical protein IKA61_07730 [Clostridia bacterium]|nr:hypothetical protein [Clostridia bacterium]
MERDNIRAKLREILELALGAKAQEILKNCSDSSDLVSDLGLNSVGILYVVIGIEEIFSISFENACFGDFKTVGDVIDYIEKKTV